MIRLSTKYLRGSFKTLISSQAQYTPNIMSLSPYKNQFIRAFSTDPKGKGNQDDQLSDFEKEQTQLYDKDGNEVKDPEKAFEEDENEDDASFTNERKKSLYIFAVAALGIIGGYAIMQMNTMREEKKTLKTQKVSYTGKADIGGSWKLHDIDGNEISSKDLKGHYYLIYFGFCNCPDICPISLQKVSKALELIRKMPEYRYVKLKTIFVSVDPDRDSPERMKKFLSYFDKSIIGVTGNSNDDPELRNMMKKFRIYASKIELDETPKKAGEKRPYTLDHTIITYLMDDANNYLTHLGSNLSDRDMASIIVDAVLQNERAKAKGERD